MRIFRYILLISVSLTAFASLTFSQDYYLDVEGTTYQDSIESLTDLGVLEGYEDGTFRPDELINRAELLKIVFVALDTDLSEFSTNCFEDVSNQWFAPYVCVAKEKGVVEGYEDNNYHPERSTNMIEAFKIAIESFDLPISKIQDNQQWYEIYTDFIHNNNIFSKYSYFPDQYITRGEMAFLVDELLQILREERQLSNKRNSASIGCSTGLKPANAPTEFTVNGIKRQVIIDLPNNYEANKPVPILFAWHGRTNSNSMVRDYYGYKKNAAKDEAIVVYPAGTANESGYSWSDSGDTGSDLRDYAFFDVMLSQLSQLYCIDEDRVYLTGHSLGAWFSNSLACARGDKVRAVASLGGSRSNSECTGPVAVMQWHNPDDTLAPYSGALITRDWYLEQNSCSEVDDLVEPSWADCREYQGCYADAPSLFCPHNVDYDYRGSYYPHTWPKGTGDEMWKFFTNLDN